MDAQARLKHFASEVVRNGELWTVYRDGYPSFERSDGGRSMPWWSSEAVATKALRDIGALSGARLVRQPLEAFTESWVDALTAFGHALCLDWEEPEDLEAQFEPAALVIAIQSIDASKALARTAKGRLQSSAPIQKPDLPGEGRDPDRTR